jgi:xanthine/uracil permease
MKTNHKQFEHRKQKVAPLSHFFARLGRYGFIAFLLVVVSVFIGTVGYHFFGRLDWVDGFYMACMILTGMGPIADMTTYESKLFSSFYALYSGVAFLSITAVFFAPIIHRLLHILHAEQENKEDERNEH